MSKPTHQDYLLFAAYSDQIDRAVAAEVDACTSVFPSRQSFHNPPVQLSEAEFKQRRAALMTEEAMQPERVNSAQCHDEQEELDQRLSKRERSTQMWGTIIGVAIVLALLVVAVVIWKAVRG